MKRRRRIGSLSAEIIFWSFCVIVIVKVADVLSPGLCNHGIHLPRPPHRGQHGRSIDHRCRRSTSTLPYLSNAAPSRRYSAVNAISSPLSSLSRWSFSSRVERLHIRLCHPEDHEIKIITHSGLTPQSSSSSPSPPSPPYSYPEGFPRYVNASGVWAGVRRDQVSNYTAFISMPLMQFSGEVVVVNNRTEKRLDLSWLEEAPVLGFDIETAHSWNSSRHSQPPAILQLATCERAAVFQLLQMSPSIRHRIQTILENENVIKVGVGIEKDVELLQRWHFQSVSAKGILDLRRIVAPFKLETNSLAMLVAFFLRFRLAKSRRRQSWDRKSLKQSQLNYAATDAYAAAQLFSTFSNSLFPGFENWTTSQTLEPLRTRFRASSKGNTTERNDQYLNEGGRGGGASSSGRFQNGGGRKKPH